MRKLDEIAGDLRAELIEHFQTVRVSSVQTAEQFGKELVTINPDNLPGVVIIFDGLVHNFENTIAEVNFTLVMVDRFSANNEERTLSVFRSGATLLELFPAEGRRINGVFVCPVDLVTASQSEQYAALALGIVCKQGV